MSAFRSELLQMPHGTEACERGQLPHKMCTSESPGSEPICSSVVSGTLVAVGAFPRQSTLWTIVYVLRSEKGCFSQ